MKKGKNRNLIRLAVFSLEIWIVSLLMIQTVQAQIKAIPESEKNRILLLTDIGGDRDDEQSFTRFLMYSDQYDIEGLIATSIRIFPNEKHRPIDGEPQPHYLVNWIKAYGEVRENLMKHSEGWPDPAMLLTMSVSTMGILILRPATSARVKAPP